MNIKEYFNKCKNHDWFYEYSDDFIVYQKGKEQRTSLMLHKEGNRVLCQIYRDWREYYLNKGTKPKLSNYISEGANE